MRGGDKVPQNPQNLTTFTQTIVGRETGGERENKSMQAKSITTRSIGDHCPINSFYGIYFGGGVSRSIVHYKRIQADGLQLSRLAAILSFYYLNTKGLHLLMNLLIEYRTSMNNRISIPVVTV
jgi:hypothetical protein